MSPVGTNTDNKDGLDALGTRNQLHHLLLSKPPQHCLEMTFTNSSNKPLLDHCPQHESDEEPPLTLAIVYGDEETSVPEDDSQWGEHFVSSVVLPVLLFLQFGMAFSTSHVQGTTGLPLQWSLVNCTIVMFVIAAALYRRAVQDCRITCLVAILLPDFVMDTGQVVPAFMLLLISMLCLAVLTIALDAFVNGCCGWTSDDDVSEKNGEVETTISVL
jgi:hypothetical protein